MDATTIIAEIKRHRPALEAAGVRHVYLFGSVARGEAGAESDVDLFFDHGLSKFGLIEYAGLKRLAEDELPFKTDFIARDCLHPAIRATAEAQAIRIF